MVKKIPETSYEKYISGWEALNTPDAEGRTADWHPYEYWYTETEEELPLYESNHLLGRDGIEKRHILYAEEEVYIASHARAVADLVWVLKESKLTMLCGFLRDFAFDEDQEAEVFVFLKKISKVKDIEWFIKRELTRRYFRQGA